VQFVARDFDLPHRSFLRERLCEDQIEKGAVPGLAIAVVFQDHVVYAAGFGVRDVNTREPVNADTVFQLASLSKAVGSTVVAELVGEGKISWDSRISNLDPELAMYDPWVTREITIRDFYAHRSGLPASAGDSLEVLRFNREQILHRLRYQKPIHFRPHARDSLAGRGPSSYFTPFDRGCH
jgi:CubicO group peptidase (beta-lactamase class C family)